jgi:hypothetical protein
MFYYIIAFCIDLVLVHMYRDATEWQYNNNVRCFHREKYAAVMWMKHPEHLMYVELVPSYWETHKSTGKPSLLNPTEDFYERS